MPPPVRSSSGGCPAVWIYLTTGDIGPASLRYNCLTPVARVAGPRCLAGSPLLGCVPARLSSVASMAPGDVCHGPCCSLAGLRPVALGYRSCHWPGGSAGWPQCVQPWGCRPLCPVPFPPWVRVRVRCPGPLGACSPVRPPFVFRARCPRPRGSCPPVRTLCAVCVCWWWFCPPSSPPPFFALYLFFFWKKGARAHCRHRHGQLMQRCSSVAFSAVRRRCFVGGRAPGVRLARLDVCGCRSGWVPLVASLRFGAGWLGGCVGSWCGLWLLRSLGRLG